MCGEDLHCFDERYLQVMSKPADLNSTTQLGLLQKTCTLKQNLKPRTLMGR